jgi:hypothetical protein
MSLSTSYPKPAAFAHVLPPGPTIFGVYVLLTVATWMSSLASASAMAIPRGPTGTIEGEALLQTSVYATVENPFAQRAFIKERESVLKGAPADGSAGDQFAYYLFETDSMVSMGHSNISFFLSDSFRNPGFMPAFHRSYPYTVDYRQSKIRIGDNREYYYKFEGAVVRLWNMTESHTLYEVGVPFFLADQNSVYWQIVRRHDAKMSEYGPAPLAEHYNIMEEHKNQAGRQMKNYIDNFIARAKGATPVPLSEAPTTPTSRTNVVAVINQQQNVSLVQKDAPSPSPQEDSNPEESAEPVDGQYNGTLIDAGDGSQWRFTMRIKSLGEPAGEPPMASIEATMKFEGVETEERLVGTAAYSAETQLIMAGNSTRGTMTLQCRLSGDQLRGTWDSKGADGQTTAGTLEATRTGP